jgi:hypothetical protein
VISSVGKSSCQQPPTSSLFLVLGLLRDKTLRLARGGFVPFRTSELMWPNVNAHARTHVKRKGCYSIKVIKVLVFWRYSVPISIALLDFFMWVFHVSPQFFHVNTPYLSINGSTALWPWPLFQFLNPIHDRLCGLVVRVPRYRSWGPGFDSRRYRIFWEVAGLERGPLSLVRIIEELLEWKSSGSGQENRINDRGDPLRW